MENSLPWWLHSLLKRYVPIYALQLLEHPWVVAWIAGTILAVKILLIIYLIYRAMSERNKRKSVEREYSFLAERYEQLKVLHLQHQTMTTLIMAQKELSDENQQRAKKQNTKGQSPPLQQ